MDWPLIVIATLAAARLTGLVIADSFSIFADVRKWLLRRYPAEDTKFYESEVTSVATFEGDEVYTLRQSGREAFREWEDGIATFYVIEPHAVGTLLSCHRCLSMWSALAILLVVLLAPWYVAYALLLPLAMSEVTILLWKV